VVETDHDSDGVLSKDLNGLIKSVRTSLEVMIQIVIHFYHLDVDDDGDAKFLPYFEKCRSYDGNPDDAEDLDGDGIPGYLDADETNLT
jgi:hypothetical protein